MRGAFKGKCLFVGLIACVAFNSAFAQRVPENVQNFVNSTFKDAYFRFDGEVILPDNTIYLPVIPAKFSSEDEKLTLKKTIPDNLDFSKKPDAVILSNDFVLLKVLREKDGTLTLLNKNTYPDEIKSGIFPQDLFLPRRLIIPEGLENIKGNLESYDLIGDIKTVVHGAKDFRSMYFKNPALKGSTIYVTTPVSKNIKAFSADNSKGYVQYTGKHSPNKIALYDDRFLLLTSYSKSALSVISLYDDSLMKEIPLSSVPEEILIVGDKAYVTSSQGHCIYEIDLLKMIPTRQIMINGMCEKFILSDDGNKLFYYDKQSKTLWGIELDNDYLLKDIGIFPNVSKIANVENKLYVTSRTKNLVAIVDYLEMNLLGEYQLPDKPVDIYAQDGKIYILCAGGKTIKIMNAEDDEFVGEINFPVEEGFPSRFYPIKNSNFVIVTDTAKPVMYVLDTKADKITGVYGIDEPISNIQIGRVIKKANGQQ